MADRLIGYPANHRDTLQIVGKAENDPKTSHNLNSSKTLPMKQPKLLPNPLLRQVRRQPAQLNLSKSIPATGSAAVSATAKPANVMSVRDKLLQGISMDLGRLQENPAAFDRMFPAKQTATTTKSKAKRARQSTDKLLQKLHSGGATDLYDEEEEARRFEKKMRSVWV